MTLSEDLVWRGLIKDHTFNDLTWLDKPQTFYLGADAGSANSLTVGNLAVFMLARRLLDAGWNTVLLMGGATSMIGDPGGKDSERELVNKETVESNIAGVKEQVKKLFDGKDFILVNNHDWFKDIGFLEFLRDVGKHYSMTELVQRDYIVDRIGQGGTGISYAEFSYSLIQGYDFWHLFTAQDVVLQIGGSDQWGNMLSGVPLIRKKEGKEAHAMSMPLVINKSTGKKFGKSEEGAVWLDEQKTSAFKFYQFWLNAGDLDAIDYLKIFTLLDKNEINSLSEEMNSNAAVRSAQKRLAYEVTSIVHGKERAEAAQHITGVLFGTEDFLKLSVAETEMLKKELSRVTTTTDIHADLVALGLARSKSESRQFLASGAVTINGVKVNEGSASQTLVGGLNLVKRGKNNFGLLEVVK
jgi:tyrosyl-tRNA synthetase